MARAIDESGNAYMSAAHLRGVTLDCDDPGALAAFYQALTGMTVGFSADDFVALTGGPGPDLGFQRVEDYRRPQWPGQEAPQQLHLDFGVDDLGTAQDLVLSLGAVKPDRQPGGASARVFLDPAGHPFCLSPRAPAR